MIKFLGEGGLQLTQKQFLIANAALLIHNEGIFIKTNTKKEFKKKFMWEEKMLHIGQKTDVFLGGFN